VPAINYRTAAVNGSKVFYREAIADGAPKLLLLHGFPTAGHMFRDLIPLLRDRFHIIAPDLPGFGNSEMPAGGHTFDRMADVIDRFTEVVGFDRYALYVFDYGAPVGLRLAVKHPERITAIVSQNGNAYAEGLSDGWNPIRSYWQNPSEANRAALRAFLKPETTIWQYTHGVPDATRVSPDGYSLDNFYLGRPGMTELQLDLFGDYQSNVALYPVFQQYFGPASHPCSQRGGGTTRSSSRREPRHSSATFRARSFASSTPVTSRSRPTPRRSQGQSVNSSCADRAHPPVHR
jgi:pimeloyl-ACP methyl ester carboxylesterase